MRAFVSRFVSNSWQLKIIFAGVLVATAPQLWSQASGTSHATNKDGDTDWPVYNGSYENTKYSKLTQINTGNVARLKEIWRFDSHETGGLETTPLVVQNTLFCLHAEAGEPSQ